MFKWAVENELVSASVLHGLQAVQALKRGRTEAKESEPVQPVARGVVEDTLPILRPMLAHMEPRAQRAKAVNDRAAELQKDAIQKGLFVISDKNFANVIGYRAPGATAKDQPRLFLPTAGGSAPAIGAPGPAGQPPMPPAEKKDEKKDDKGGI